MNSEQPCVNSSASQFLVTAPGSLGDVNPLLAIARQLHRVGHRVLFLAAERYLPLAQRAGLETRCLVSETQFQRLASNPQLWHPRHGARLIFKEAVGHFLAEHYQWLEDNCQPGQTVLVSHVLDFAGRVFRDRHPATKFVSVLPAPALLRSSRTPPRLSGFFWERWVPRFCMPLVYASADVWVDRTGGPQINRLRKSIGLPAVRRLLHHWWWSPELVLCLFPEWYSIDGRDLPRQMRHVGFPLADSQDVVAPEVTQQLERILQGFGTERPLVFAPGTAHQHAADFLRVANQACRQLKRPGVLISSDASQFPSPLADNVVAAQYLPFSRLLPHASALFHHGGIGTTSQALKAGIPQVVLPMAFDQFDNAERVARLGCGSWLPMRQVTLERLLAHWHGLPRTASQATAVSSRMPAQQQCLDQAVDSIHSIL